MASKKHTNKHLEDINDSEKKRRKTRYVMRTLHQTSTNRCIQEEPEPTEDQELVDLTDGEPMQKEQVASFLRDCVIIVIAMFVFLIVRLGTHEDRDQQRGCKSD